jgi:glutaminyl-peptide cyclotransferase
VVKRVLFNHFLAVLALTFCACGPSVPAGIPTYTYQVVHAYPHDPEAFTEGLFYDGGFLYESTGLEGHSSVRKVRLETGEIVEKHDLLPTYFGEGIVRWKDKMMQLTYKTEVGFIYDFKTFEVQKAFDYKGEGWALTTDGKRIIMDDGTPEIRFWDPETLQETGRITVTDQGQPVKDVNELEWIKGEIFANIWQTDKMARIDPVTGKVAGWIDMTGLLSPSDVGNSHPDVLNGIAYDAKNDRIFVTGKKWPKLYEIRLILKK